MDCGWARNRCCGGNGESGSVSGSFLIRSTPSPLLTCDSQDRHKGADDPSISPRLEPAPVPLVNRAGAAMVIDGRITRENFERFMAAHSPPEG